MLCMDLMDICYMFFIILLASISTNLHNSEHLKYFNTQYSPTFSKIRLKTQPGLTQWVNPGRDGHFEPWNLPLQKIFDKTFTEGCVPKLWKDANISALYKNKGDMSETTNYRPVSLTCLPSRLCEKTVRDAIMKHE